MLSIDLVAPHAEGVRFNSRFGFLSLWERCEVRVRSIRPRIETMNVVATLKGSNRGCP